MEIHYSRGTSVRDNSPETKTVADFGAFMEAVLSDTAKAKGLQYIAAPFKVNGNGKTHRSKEGVLSSAFIALDLDGFTSPEDWHATIAALQKSQGFAYSTYSSTPDAPRARVVLAASREMDRGERLRVSMALERWLNKEVGDGCIVFDSSTHKAEQPLFTPPEQAETYRFSGKPVDVDKVLATAPEAEPQDATAHERAEQQATEDPVLSVLQDKGMVLRSLEAGRFAITCPFEHEHTEQTADTATVYMLPNFGGVPDGKFKCMHSHCSGRTQQDFLLAIGLEPKQVWKAHRAGKPATTAVGPEPLEVVDTAAPVYPVEALGPILGGAAKALHEEIQAPLSMCGQSVLTAAAMCVQGHVNVQPPHGRPHPVSLFAMTTGGSGDRKSATDREAMAPIVQHERELEQEAETLLADYESEMEAYEEARKAAKNGAKKEGQQAILQALRNLEKPGDPPLMPYMVAEDPTVEGLYRSFKEGYPSQGCFTDEAGLLIGGHALNQDNFVKTISRLSKLWDGGSFDRTRGGDERGKLHGRRLALHWLVQPMVAAELFERRIAEAQGFFPRCLLAIPDTLAGGREYKATQVHSRPEMGRYYAALTRLLREPLPLDENGRGLLPGVIGLTADARARYAEFFNFYERQNGPKGELGHLQPFVSRIAEQGVRIAAVLHVVEHGTGTREIDRSTLDNGFRLAEFSLQEWERLKAQAAVSTEIRNAKALLEWAQEQPTQEDGQTYVYSRQIQRLGLTPCGTSRPWNRRWTPLWNTAGSCH